VKKIRIPWWANPWRAYTSERYRHQLTKAVHKESLDLWQRTVHQLHGDNSELRRQLENAKALPDGMASTEVPEFIFIGIPRPDGSKRLWASKDLAGTAFSMHSDGLKQPKWKIGAVMAQSLTVDGPDYGTCIERVLKIWANWISNARGLPRYQKAPPVPAKLPWSSPSADIKGDVRKAIEGG
jgi:hypothetical protein